MYLSNMWKFQTYVQQPVKQMTANDGQIKCIDDFQSNTGNTMKFFMWEGWVKVMRAVPEKCV